MRDCVSFHTASRSPVEGNRLMLAGDVGERSHVGWGGDQVFWQALRSAQNGAVVKAEWDPATRKASSIEAVRVRE